MTLGPVATQRLCATLARILEDENPGLGRVEVSVVEGERQRSPRPAVLGKINGVVLPDDANPAGERRRAA